jgi:DNA-directed RNA polymerase subunit RPC12/RpoP
VADLSFVYKCGKCNRNFPDPDQLKNHEIPCRGRRPVEEVALMPRHQAEKNLAGHFPKARTIEFRRGLETYEFE